MKIPGFGRSVAIVAQTRVNPSEDHYKVADAIKNVLPSLDPILHDKEILEAHSVEERTLHHIYEQVRQRRTSAAFRKIMLRNSTESSTWMHLNKQAATVGVVVVCEDASESPLGPIILRITANPIVDLIDWLVPQ
ncbi:MAG: hypothetical protein CMO12_03555 [Thaumarchaeota archaeon]|nr:hypothetical protein [Nitrososphaerota archaeon]